MKREMNIEKFADTIISDLKGKLMHAYRIETTFVQKPNQRPEPALSVYDKTKKTNTSPVIYLRPLYESYVDGKPMSAITDDVLTIYRQGNPFGNYDLDGFLDFEEAKKRIVCRLINTEINRDLLNQIPHKNLDGLNLSIIFYYLIDNSRSIMIRNSHTYVWHVDDNNLYKIAADNTRRLLPYQILRIDELLQDMTDLEVTATPVDNTCSDMQLYILTNAQQSYGAVNIIYNDVLDKVCDQIGCSDIYLLPSSVHEFIAISADSWCHSRPSELREIVAEINDNYIRQEDYLATAVYRYSRDTGELIAVA